MTPTGRRLSWLVLLLSLFSPAALAAQAPAHGTLIGTVTDETDAPLRDVLVTITERTTGTRRSMMSDRFGTYRFPFLQPGSYDVLAERIGYQPVTLLRVPVRPAQVMTADVRLGAGTPMSADSAAFPGAAHVGGSPGASQWASAGLVQSVPAVTPRLGGMFRYFSTASADLGAEGLPGSMSALALDGHPFRPVPHPLLRTALNVPTGLTAAGVANAQFVTNATDVEWNAPAGGILAAHSLRGTETSSGFAAGAFSSASIAAGDTDGQSVSGTDVLGRAALRGPLFEDSARFTVGVDVQSLGTPATANWQLTGDVPPGVERQLTLDNSAFTAFARFDWNVSDGHQVETTAQFASLPSIAVVDPVQGTVPLLKGTDLLAGVALNSALGERTANTFRVSFSSAGRETDTPAERALTRVVGNGLTFGGATGMSAVDEMAVRITDALHMRFGTHHVKVGADVAFDRWDVRHREGVGGTFLVSDQAAWSARSGSYVSTDGTARQRSFNTNSAAFFLQDYWTASPGVQIQAGVRVERQVVPDDEVRLDPEFQRLSGVSNTAFDAPGFRISPRGSLTWDVGNLNRWIVHLAGGIYNDRIDPLLLAQWQEDDGTSTVHRVIGDISNPGSTAGFTANRLTVLGPGFDAPSTRRVSGGFSFALGDATSLHVSAAVRRTENLPRRTDLNRLQALYRDQFGRPVYGELRKFGGLVVAEPGSGRRFEGYDDVAAMSSDGTSDYAGVSIGIERSFGALQGALRYTFSSTEDNWVGARQGGWTIAMPRLAQDGWDDGTSDFDVPHRAVLALAWTGPMDIGVSGLVRYESGMPFTPGFRNGVDIDGDGWSNDPAIVDAAMPGMDALRSKWSCIADAPSNAPVERNACRTDARTFVDVAVSVPVIRFGRGAAGIFAGVFNALDTRHDEPDAALYLVEPATPLSVSGGTVNVPLAVNPDFGEPLGRRQTGRLLRFGVSLTW